MGTNEPKRKRNILTTPLNILLAVIVLQVLRIFLPWEWVTVITSLVIVFSVYKWATAKVGVSPGWAKFIALVAIFIFLGNLLSLWIDKKYPWFSKALSARQLYYSFIITDKLDPKFLKEVAMKLYKIDEKDIKMQQAEYFKILDEIDAKMDRDEKLTKEDREKKETVRQKLMELEKEMDSIIFVRPKGSAKKLEKKNIRMPQTQNYSSKRLAAKSRISTEKLGQDFNLLTFTGDTYVFKNKDWRVQLNSIEALPNGNFKLNLVHTTLRQVSRYKGYIERIDVIWIRFPKFNTYLVDNLGNRYKFIEEEGLGSHGDNIIKEPHIGYLEFPFQVPIAYSLIFSKLNEDAEEIIFVCHYSWCIHSAVHGGGCAKRERSDIIIRGIKLFKEMTESQIQKTETGKPSPVKETTSSLQ